MGQSLTKMIVHIVFSTKHRLPMIDAGIAPELHAYIGGICHAMECTPIKIGGYTDHVHVLCQLSKKITLAELLEEIKKRSSKWIKTKGEQYQAFYWQNGYGVFSVSPKQVDQVIDYISHQEEHHARLSFQDEYRQFLNQYQITFDENYVWD